jgi:2-oxoglutarate ferredoxin oxidoreductase subunit alpha
MKMRSHKLVTLQKSLKPPKVYGDPQGDLLVVNWGSTRGAIEEAVDRLRAEGIKVSSVTLRFLSPMEPGLKEIFSNFKQVMTIELNYSDDHDDPVVLAEYRRRSQLARVLRQMTLVDVDCWSRVPGVPLSPSQVEAAVREKLSRVG